MANGSNTGWYVAIGTLGIAVIALTAVIVHLLPSKHPAPVAAVQPKPTAAAAPVQGKASHAKDDRFVEGAIVGGILGSVVTHVIDSNNQPRVVVVEKHGHGRH